MEVFRTLQVYACVLIGFVYSVSSSHLLSTRRPCGGDSFICDNYQCITNDKYCDGQRDCADGSDEPRNCAVTDNSKTAEGLVIIIIGLVVLIIMTAVAILFVCKTNACAKQSRAEVPGESTVSRVHYGQQRHQSNNDVTGTRGANTGNEYVPEPVINADDIPAPAYLQEHSVSTLMTSGMLPPSYEEATRSGSDGDDDIQAAAAVGPHYDNRNYVDDEEDGTIHLQHDRMQLHEGFTDNAESCSPSGHETSAEAGEYSNMHVSPNTDDNPMTSLRNEVAGNSENVESCTPSGSQSPTCGYLNTKVTSHVTPNADNTLSHIITSSRGVMSENVTFSGHENRNNEVEVSETNTAVDEETTF